MSLHLGDCLEVLKTLEAESMDALVTDPPAGIQFMGVGWDTFRTPKGKSGHDRSVKWDQVGGNHHPINLQGRVRTMRAEGVRFRAFLTAVAEECYRVMKPGAHGLVWAIPRTSHWTGTALEDAGFEVRDQITHHFGSGFPKSLNVSAAIDQAEYRRREGLLRKALAEKGYLDVVWNTDHE